MVKKIKKYIPYGVKKFVKNILGYESESELFIKLIKRNDVQSALSAVREKDHSDKDSKKIEDFEVLFLESIEKKKCDESLSSVFCDCECCISLEYLRTCYRLAINSSFFELAFYIRDAIQKKILLSPTYNSVLLDSCFESEQSCFNGCEFEDVFLFYKNLISLKSEDNSSVPLASKLDCDFLKLIKNKSVALVGPSYSEEKLGDEIDGFDVVVRFNEKIGRYLDSDIYGRRVDVSYYNNVGVHDLASNSDQWNTGLKFSVFYEQAHLDKILNTCDLSNSGIRVAPLFESNKYWFNGCFNGVQRVVSDLLKFAPSRIKVFHSNLMLEKRVIKGYKTHEDSEMDKRVGKKRVREMVFPHDPYLNFRFLQNVYKNGYFEADQELDHIMKMEVYEFFIALESVYSGNVGFERVDFIR